MVKFNELEIKTASNCFVIDAAVKELACYADVFIKAVYIATEDNYTKGIPTSVVYSQQFEASVDPTGTLPKAIRLELKDTDLLINSFDHILFVYVETVGVPTIDVPCGEDNIVTVGMAFDKQPLYNKSMCFITKLDVQCDIPKDFLDYMLKVQAIEFAFKTNNFEEAIYYYKSFFQKKTVRTYCPTPKCSCNG